MESFGFNVPPAAHGLYGDEPELSQFMAATLPYSGTRPGLNPGSPAPKTDTLPTAPDRRRPTSQKCTPRLTKEYVFGPTECPFRWVITLFRVTEMPLGQLNALSGGPQDHPQRTKGLSRQTQGLFKPIKDTLSLASRGLSPADSDPLGRL